MGSVWICTSNLPVAQNQIRFGSVLIAGSCVKTKRNCRRQVLSCFCCLSCILHSCCAAASLSLKMGVVSVALMDKSRNSMTHVRSTSATTEHSWMLSDMLYNAATALKSSAIEIACSTRDRMLCNRAARVHEMSASAPSKWFSKYALTV